MSGSLYIPTTHPITSSYRLAYLSCLFFIYYIFKLVTE
ncbi:hypothetical protein BCN_P182 (plasmid) [Bacillus cereus NC7401]|nr:hypothetical protein BCN_P182 [Bacillus cereus NC7401]